MKNVYKVQESKLRLLAYGFAYSMQFYQEAKSVGIPIPQVPIYCLCPSAKDSGINLSAFKLFTHILRTKNRE
jgi:hypothetical protein